MMTVFREVLSPCVRSKRVYRLMCGLVTGVVFISSISNSVVAKELPVWEAGVGAAGLSMSHYIGADESGRYGFAYPFFIYRSEYIQADREGLRGKLFQRENLRLNISLNASLPVNSEDNHTREGMDDLDPMLEIGPTLQYRFYQSSDKYHSWKLDFPIRAGLTFDDLDVSHRGWISNPSVVYSGGDSRWKQWMSIGPMFADRRYHEYYYDVEQEFVQSGREEYHAKSGYTGLKLSLSLRRKFKQLSIGGFVRYVDLHGAANEDSPLVKAKGYFAIGVAIHWRMAQSSDTVRVKSSF